MARQSSERPTQQLIDNLDVVAFYSAQIPALRINGHLNAKVDCPFECGGGKSFSVDRERGLYLCHRCGAKGSPWGFLEQRGYGPAQIRATLMDFQRGEVLRGSAEKGARNRNAPLGRIIKTYDYVDEMGELLFQVTRHEPKDFRQRRKGPDGKWINNIIGVRRVLYGLPGLINAVNSGWTVYIVEGEKDADAINGLESCGGFFATTAAMGAKAKWLPDFTPFFAGANVLIVADKGDVGVQRALDVRFHLLPVAKSVGIVMAKTGKDAFDHLAAGHTLADFVPMPGPVATAESVSVLVPTSFRDISDPGVLKVPWLIEGLIPAAGLTIVAAHYKTGKTFLMYRLILDALFARLALGSFPIPRPLKVQLWQFEMPLDVNLRRFHKLARGIGIDPEQIYEAEKAGRFQAFVQPDLSLTDAGDLAVFHGCVDAFAPDLLLVDSLSEAFADADFNATRDVRKMLRNAFRPVTAAGRGTVCLHHKRKLSGGREDDAKGSILGSQAFGAAARAIYTLDRIRDEGPEIKGRFVLCLAPQGGWDLETRASVFVIADNETGTQTTVEPASGKDGKRTKAITLTTHVAIRLAELAKSRHGVGRQSAFEIVRLEFKCGLSIAKDALKLAIERKWVLKEKAEGSKQNEQVLRPGVNTDWEDEL